MAKTELILSCFLALFFSFPAWSIDTVPIEQVRTQCTQSNTQPNAAAIQVIDEFWRKSIDTMMLTEDTGEMVSLRLDLKKFRGDNHLSFYASAYLKASRNHLKVAIDTVGKWEGNSKKVRVERNLMILIAELGSVELADLALVKLSDNDPMVRYWAVRSLTSGEVVLQLKDDVTRDEKLTSQIISAFEEYLKTTKDTLSLPFIADFAVGMNTPVSRHLLWTLADQRINAYMKWTVSDEAVDARILKSMGGLIPDAIAPERQELLRRFGQLYSCVLQRYMRGENLSQASKDQLVTVIVEVDINVVSKQIVGWISKFRTDLKNTVSLEKDYELLFGTNGQAGELADKLKFDYGKDSSGKILVLPRPLAAPPAPAVSGTSAVADSSAVVTQP